jgi:hypothetical protein
MIDKSSLYKLPWVRENNPNGWIEPTTHCQLKCPLCFRGCDRDGFVPVHMELDDVKKEVDDLIRLRNVETISIAGGEPLLYPHFDEMIQYIRSRDVEAMVLTNGISLDEEMLRRLRRLDVARVVIHIDKYQGRDGITTEAQANKLRQGFCDLFRKIPGVSLGFIQPLGLPDLDDLPVLLNFFKENADVVDLVTFNRFQAPETAGFSEDKLLDAENLFESVREVYGLEYGAYLGKTHTDKIGWLFGQAVFSGKSYVGSLDAKAFRFFQEQHLRNTGRYLHCSRASHLSARLLAFALFNRSLRRIVLRHLFNGREKLHRQLILLINTPEPLGNGDYDRCAGCPDAMMFGGKLVPSCMLELIKEGVDVEAG